MDNDAEEQNWKLAFGAIILEIECSEEIVMRDLYLALWNNRNNPKKQLKELLACLGKFGWKWNQFPSQCVTETDVRKMAEMLIIHLSRTAHALFRREQITQEIGVGRVYLEFTTSEGEDVPDECRANNGTILHYSAPFWDANLPPCGRICCVCQVQTLAERDLKKLRQ